MHKVSPPLRFFSKLNPMSKTVQRLYLYQGKEYPCQVTFRRGMRRITLRFGKQVGTLAVSAPYLTSYKTIDDMVKKYLPKLLTHQDRAYSLPYGEDWMYLMGNKEEISFPDEESRKKFLLKKAKPLYLERLRHYEAIMGVTPPYKLSIRSMKSRYGSNSKKTHRISLSLELIHYDVSVLDSVVVHELCHHTYFDHGPKFHALILRFCPDYPRLRKVLLKKDYGYHPDIKEE